MYLPSFLLNKENPMNKVKVESLVAGSVTIRSNDKSKFIVLNTKNKSHTFVSEKEYALFDKAISSFRISGMVSIKIIKEDEKKVETQVKTQETTTPAAPVKPVKDVEGKILKLKEEFKASNDEKRKKAIKVEIRGLNKISRESK